MYQTKFKIIQTASDTFAVVDIDNKKTLLFQKKNNVSGFNNISGQPEKIVKGKYGYILYSEHDFEDLEEEVRKLDNPLYKYDFDVDQLHKYSVNEDI